MTKILKKDGQRIEKFDEEKIYRAVTLASDRVNINMSPMILKTIALGVMQKIKDYKIIQVEDLHSLVIAEIEKYEPKVADSYRKYRGYKERFNKTFNNILSDTKDLLSNGDKENANKDSNLVSTKKELVSGIVSKAIAYDYELPTDVAEAHIRGDIHSHDGTDEIFGSINCCLFDMKNLLKDGFKINGIQNTEPNHLETALDIVSDVILQASSQQFGGFTVPEIDHVLAKYVEIGYNEYLEKFSLMQFAFNQRETFEKWVETYVYDILLHGFENKFDHRLNTINNANGQTSFTTLTFGLDTTRWGRLVSKAILNARMNGLGVNKITAIFPKLVFLHRAEINGDETSPNYDIKQLAIQCSMLNMYPDWLSLDSGYLGDIYDMYKKAISPMGCRAYLSPWYIRGGMNPKDKDDIPVFIGRANCGAVSLNLPRYAIESDGDYAKFIKTMRKNFNLAIKKHLYKYNKLRGVKASSNPLFFCEGGCHIKLKYNDTIEEAIKTFTWSIGYIGLDEVTRYFYKCGLDEDNSVAIHILKTLNRWIEEAKKETNLLIALYSTPSESLCNRFLKMDKEKYGVIEGVTDKEYYTNSFHVDVRKQINAIRKQLVEKPMFDLAKGGRIVYNEFPHTKNKVAVTQIINHAMRLGLYYGINLKLDNCLDCHNRDEFKDNICPKCGSSNIVSINRICGYLGYYILDGGTRVNEGKHNEISLRTDHFEG